MVDKIYIFDSHPVQYKAPVYQALQQAFPDCFEVIYATDASVRAGHVDEGFGKEVVWDTPLLSGYPFRVLGNERGTPLTTPGSLTGRGIFSLLRLERPRAIVLTQSRYWFDHAAYISSLILGIPILIRQETQDEMFAGQRSPFREALRSAAYRLMYAPVKHAFAFGKLNYEHLTRHGISPGKISFARFSVPNPIKDMDNIERDSARQALRQELGVDRDQIIVGFFGKLIPKKNPELIFESLAHIPEHIRRRLHLMFVGAGELQNKLDQLADSAKRQFGVQTSFTGFVNQTKLAPYYLTADMVVLPSRRMGEAWGLVINEALNAGCSVVVSDAVGCKGEFDHLERMRVVPVGDHKALGDALTTLSTFDRNYVWAASCMAAYSSAAAAQALKETLCRYLHEPLGAAP